MAKSGAHVLVSGMVQGVSFRYYTMQAANHLGITGWVRNLADGRVEAVFEGEAEEIDRMLAWCREGPRSARVEHVEVLPQAFSGEYDSFRIR
jgi:acylphosphatase